MSEQSYDLIGDIHGHSAELNALLTKLDYHYDEEKGFNAHPEERKVIFVGDLIDRGPDIRGVLRIVKPMVDNGLALCVQGNHEYNAVNFWERPIPKREHNHKNIIQHFQTIKAFQNREEEWEEYLEWFRTLPYYLDLPGLRVVHACWDDHLLSDDLNEEILEKCLKGQEIILPPGISFKDKDGNVRTKARTKWWINPDGLMFSQYLETYAANQPGLDKVPVGPREDKGYPKDAKPVFFGHYWLRGEPQLQAHNVCCLDYSVAKGGELIAYRFDGEQELNSDKFVTVYSSDFIAH